MTIYKQYNEVVRKIKSFFVIMDLFILKHTVTGYMEVFIKIFFDIITQFNDALKSLNSSYS